ncbi:hypothetical protein GGQ86_000811 [Xanthobacter flavus]|uniref:Uncharacterized protein n=1 Tax=Xanthobacter flavus TaxID=281 RepID=A0A9W6FL24_XANFL|nr:hypothetical protein [Xanthobacter flavus]MDR6332364.1 hypothetical protein [Xanthobacter flavus]GLI21887.1 hypothetical protein XFLAVUS301_15610 [Xanthobacter flavus]
MPICRFKWANNNDKPIYINSAHVVVVYEHAPDMTIIRTVGSGDAFDAISVREPVAQVVAMLNGAKPEK